VRLHRLGREIPKTWCVRTIGVEEELLLVDERTGAPMAIAERLLRHWDMPDMIVGAADRTIKMEV
jgi:HD-like signal output (HDOD) protein